MTSLVQLFVAQVVAGFAEQFEHLGRVVGLGFPLLVAQQISVESAQIFFGLVIRVLMERKSVRKLVSPVHFLTFSSVKRGPHCSELIFLRI